MRLIFLGFFLVGQLTEYELCIASNLVDPLSMIISWKDIGGLKETIQEIRETVILPFQRNDLFKDSALIQSPKGRLYILLIKNCISPSVLSHVLIP